MATTTGRVTLSLIRSAFQLQQQQTVRIDYVQITIDMYIHYLYKREHFITEEAKECEQFLQPYALCVLCLFNIGKFCVDIIK